MNISTKQRGWVLGAALLLTVAATAAVNNQDDGGSGVIHRESSKTKDSNSLQASPSESIKGKEHLAASEMTSALFLVDQ